MRRPRPRRRSGWLTTDTTRVTTCEQALERRHRELRGAEEGEAQAGGGRGVHAGVAEPASSSSWRSCFLRLLHVELALEAADAVDEEDAVEVVDLVLEADRLEPLGVDRRAPGPRDRWPAGARCSARSTSASKSGTERQPSVQVILPSRSHDLRVHEHQRAASRRLPRSTRCRRRSAGRSHRPGARRARCRARRTSRRTCPGRGRGSRR